MGRWSKVAVPRRRGEKMVGRNLRLPASFDARVAEEAKRRKLTFADLVVEAFALRKPDPIYPDTPEEARWRKATGREPEEPVS